MTLEWRQLPVQEPCFVSICGRYSVALDGQHNVWRAYRLAPGGPWFTAMSIAVDEQAAKAAAEADAG